jgi:hypothetical protein
MLKKNTVSWSQSTDSGMSLQASGKLGLLFLLIHTFFEVFVLFSKKKLKKVIKSYHLVWSANQ